MRSAAFFEDDARCDSMNVWSVEPSHVPFLISPCAIRYTPVLDAVMSLRVAGGRLVVVAGGPALGPSCLTLMGQPMAAGREGGRLLRKQKALWEDHQIGREPF